MTAVANQDARNPWEQQGIKPTECHAQKESGDKSLAK
jgi:hypothetical protein